MAKVPNDTLNDYRYERKFFVSELIEPEIDLMVKLHPASFSEIYHERFINNIYLDSFDMKNYFENVDGLKDRVKVRIRWYGHLFGFIDKPVLELKIKKGLVGRKESFPLVPFSVDENLQRNTIVDVFNRSEIPEILKLDLNWLEASLLNRYRRKYFQSADRKYRITIDSEMEFYQIRAYNNAFLHKSVDLKSMVVELKYTTENDQYVEQIANYFPVRISRSSKYVNGIERVYL
jgi:hypothetical protein